MIINTKSDDSSIYQQTLQELIQSIQKSRHEMLKSVSKQTVNLYWNIGKTVSEKISKEKWGDSVIETLSKDLQLEFLGIRGFSPSNLWRMKAFYDKYAKNKKLAPLVREIGWVQNCLILEKCKDELEIEFYLRQTNHKGWSKLDLKDKLDHKLFQNQLLAQNNFDETVADELKQRVAWEFVDDYNVELINPDQPIAERELENTIVDNIVNFLGQMGGNFAFVGRQIKVELDDKVYFIDLLFFNFKLNCYVVIELKAREFNPKDIGQLQMYLALTNNKIKSTTHNATIGILICRTKNRTEVEYMLNSSREPMGVATYNNYQTINELPEEIAQYLPTETQVIEKLLNLE